MLFYKMIKGTAKLLLNILYRIEVIGHENIPMEGSCIVCSNHFSLLDPVVIGTLMPRKINYMAKEELFSNKVFSKFLKKLGVFPVKRGASDISAIKTALRILKDGEVMGMFPEGSRSKSGQTLEAKPGLAMIAIKSQSIVIPAAIIGTYRPFSKMKIIIDKPMDLSEYYNERMSTEEYQKISQKILNKIKNLIN